MPKKKTQSPSALLLTGPGAAEVAVVAAAVHPAATSRVCPVGGARDSPWAGADEVLAGVEK